MDLYVTTCRLVMQAKNNDVGALSEICQFLPHLRQSLTCCVCGTLIVIPMGPSKPVCLHHVCKKCVGGKMRLRPSCGWCRDYDDFIENCQLRIIVQCYHKLCCYLSLPHIMKDLHRVEDVDDVDVVALIEEGVQSTDSYSFSQTLPKPSLDQILQPGRLKRKSLLNKTKCHGKYSRKFKYRKTMKEKQTDSIVYISEEEKTNDSTSCGCSRTEGVRLDSCETKFIPNDQSLCDFNSNDESGNSKYESIILNHKNNLKEEVNEVTDGATVSDIEENKKRAIEHVEEIIRSVNESSDKFNDYIEPTDSRKRHHHHHRHHHHSSSEDQYPALHSDLNHKSSENNSTSSNNSPTKQHFRLEHDPLEALSPEKITARVCIEHDYMKDSSAYYSVTMSSATEPKLTIRRRPVTDIYTSKKLKFDSLSLVSSEQAHAFSLPKPRKISRPRKDKQKKKGCRCGTATPTPGKLTCCGQRCPCYTSYKACVDCSCRGCHNPRRSVQPPVPTSMVLDDSQQLVAPDNVVMMTHDNLIMTEEDVEISVV